MEKDKIKKKNKIILKIILIVLLNNVIKLIRIKI
jgi:hypothetical protein